MLRLTQEDGKPAAWLDAIRHQFTIREVVGEPEAGQDAPQEAAAALAATAAPAAPKRLAPAVCDAPGAQQDRRACCGTMNLAEYYNIERVLDAEAQALARWCAERGRNGPAGQDLPIETPPSGDQSRAAPLPAAFAVAS
jgi:hypothetical protein